jgi:threonylcarbamoyladenosine tRNA methylthiotransferase MtaB
VVLTGVHLGSWGHEWESHLRELLLALLRDTEVPRLRLSSLEPWDLDTEFFALWEDPRLCQHLHLPLQAGCDTTLRRMARKTTTESFRELVAAARRRIPEVAITTDIIAGFPGETEQEFAASLDFVREMAFAGGHAFSYSPRPGTAAADMDGQVDPRVRKARTAAYRQEFAQAAARYRRRFLGRELPVLWEALTRLDDQGWQVEGLTGNYLRVRAVAEQPRWNRIDRVRLTCQSGEGLRGEILVP